MPEGMCNCECSKCAEGDHCENPDTGCFVTTGPDVDDPITMVSKTEMKALQEAMQTDFREKEDTTIVTELDW